MIGATAVGLLLAMKFGLLFGVGPFKLLAVLVGIALFAGTYRWPLVTARITIVWIPLSPVLLSLLLRLGAPVQMVSMGTYLRSGLVLALVAAAWAQRRAAGEPLDVIDRLGIAYVCVIVTYLLIAPLVESSPLSFATRLQGVQGVAVFVLAFLTMRWLAPSEAEATTLRRWATGVIVLLAVVGIYQRLNQTGFNELLFNHIGIDRYFREVADLQGSAYYNATRYFFEQPLRVVSFSLNPFAFADLMLCGVALGLVGLTTRPLPIDTTLLGLGAIGVFLSGNRISIVAAACMMLAALASRSVSELAKVRFAVIAIFAVVALVPMLLSSRLVSDASYDGVSNDEHLTEITSSIELIVSRPIGGGIGSDAFVSRRASVNTSINSGNTVLGVGIQMGVLGLGVFSAFLWAVASRTRRHREHPGGGILLAQVLLVGSFVSGMTHNSWQDAGAGPVTWLLIGLGLSAPGVFGARAPRERHAGPHPLLAAPAGPSDRHTPAGRA